MSEQPIRNGRKQAVRIGKFWHEPIEVMLSAHRSEGGGFDWNIECTFAPEVEFNPEGQDVEFRYRIAEWDDSLCETICYIWVADDIMTAALVDCSPYYKRFTAVPLCGPTRRTIDEHKPCRT